MEIQLGLEKLVSHYINIISYTASLPIKELRKQAIELLVAEVDKLKKAEEKRTT